MLVILQILFFFSEKMIIFNQIGLDLCNDEITK